MSEFSNVVVRGTHRVHHTNEDGLEVVSTKADGIVKMRTATFDELAALGAVRKAKKADRETPPSETGDSPVTKYSAEEVAGFVAKRIGGGRWDVVNGEVTVGSDFDSKTAAEDWITEQGAALSKTEG